MKNKGLIFGGIAALALLGYKAMRVKNVVDNLRWSIDSISINKKDTNLLNIALNLRIKVVNPSNEPVSFDGFFASISLKGKHIAEFTRKANISLIPGNSFIEVPTSISTLGFASEIFSLLKSLIGGQINESVLVSGTLYAGGLSLPLRQTLPLKIGGEGVGKARVSLEFANNEEAAEYFQKSNIYVKAGPAKGFSKN